MFCALSALLRVDMCLVAIIIIIIIINIQDIFKDLRVMITKDSGYTYTSG